MVTKKARVIVNLRPDILDVQGQTIQASLQSLGFTDIKSLRVGKIIEIEMSEPVDAQTLKRIEKMSRDVLANPIIEDFTVETI